MKTKKKKRRNRHRNIKHQQINHLLKMDTNIQKQARLNIHVCGCVLYLLTLGSLECRVIVVLTPTVNRKLKKGEGVVPCHKHLCITIVYTRTWQLEYSCPFS